MFFFQLQPLRCIRGQQQFVLWDFGLLSFGLGLGFGWVVLALGYHDHDVAQTNKTQLNNRQEQQQQNALEKQANNKANFFLFFLFSDIHCNFLLFFFFVSLDILGLKSFFICLQLLRFITKHLKFST